MEYIQSGSLNTAGTTTTLNLPSLIWPHNTLFPAQSVFLVIANPTGSAQTINAANLIFTLSVGGVTSTLIYALPTVSIAAGSNQTFLVLLTNGVLPSPSLTATFAGNPSAGTLNVGAVWNQTIGGSSGGGSSSVTLLAGSAIAGKFGIDQTTPGTTNAVVAEGQYNASQPTLSTGQYAPPAIDVNTNLITDQMGLDPADDGLGAARPYSPGSIAIATSGAGYVTGNVVGGIISIPTVNFLTGRRVSLTGLTINDKGGVAPALNIYFFPTTPTGGTYTDKVALVWGTADRALCCGQIQVLNGNYLTDISQSGVTFGGLNTKLNVGATTLFAIIVAEGSYNLATSTISIVPQFNQE